MAASGFTPLQLYYSNTASQAPLAANLAYGELALNITDGKLFYKDNSGVVQVIATKGSILTPYTTNGILYASSTTQLAQITTPSVTNTYLYWNGTSFAWGSVATTTTISATSTNATYYLDFQSATTGSTNTDYVNANVTVNPGLGTLSAPQVNASNGIHVNSRTIAVSYAIPSGSSAMSVGPITVNSGITVTVPSGGKWVVL